MTRPTTTPTWATTGGTRLEPSAGEKASGYVAATRPPARKLNWLSGLLADWAGYLASITDANDEHTYPTPKTYSVLVPLAEGRALTADDGTAPTWAFNFTSFDVRKWVSRGVYGELLFDLSKYIRTGDTLVQVEILCKPGDAESGGLRMSCFVACNSPSFLSPATNPVAGSVVGSAAYDDGTANAQVVTIALTGTPNRAGSTYQLGIYASSNGNTTPDTIYGVKLTATRPGPR